MFCPEKYSKYFVLGNITNVTEVNRAFRAARPTSSSTQTSSKINMEFSNDHENHIKSLVILGRICNWPTAISCVEDPDAILPEHASSDRFPF